MKINKTHDNIRSGLASQSLASQLVFADVAEHDYRQATVKSVLPHSLNSQTYLADYSSNFFTIKDEDNQLTRDLRFKDIFNKSTNLPRKPAIYDLVFFSGRSIAKRCLLLTATISYNSFLDESLHFTM